MLRTPRMTLVALKKHLDAKFARIERHLRDNARRWAANDRRWEANDRRWEANEHRWEASDRRAAKLESRFDSLEQKLESMINGLNTKYVHHDRVLGEHEARLRDLEDRIDGRTTA